jgi:DNA-binding CsgD family transcriptional regulator
MPAIALRRVLRSAVIERIWNSQSRVVFRWLPMILRSRRNSRRLCVLLLSDGHGLSLLLSERKLGIAPEDLVSLGLSRREAEVLAGLAGGKTNREIAGILGLSPATIKYCEERIFAKLKVGTRAAATAIAVARADEAV